MEKLQQGGNVSITCPHCTFIIVLPVTEYTEKDSYTCTSCKKSIELQSLKEQPKFIKSKRLKK
jgi:hypothetical protein